MLISRKFLFRTLIAFSFFVPFPTQAAEERKGDPSEELVSQLGGMSLKEVSVQLVAQLKIESVPPSFKAIKFDVSFKGGKARVRQHTLKDINETWIQRICSHDPTDPMDKSDPQASLPSQEEIRESFSQVLTGESASSLYGIYNAKDGQIMGTYTFGPGRHFYHAIESTIKIHRDFRGLGIATSVVKGMLETTRKLGCVGPLFYIEASINESNVGSIKSHLSAGMILFPQVVEKGIGLYYYPLHEGLGAPIPIPYQPAAAMLIQQEEKGQ